MLLAAPQFNHKHLCHVTLQSRPGPLSIHTKINFMTAQVYCIVSVSLLWGNTIRVVTVNLSHVLQCTVPERKMHCLLSKKLKVIVSYFKHSDITTKVMCPVISFCEYPEMADELPKPCSTENLVVYLVW